MKPSPITLAQLDQNAAANRLLGIREVTFDALTSERAQAELAKLPGARVHSEPKFSIKDGWEIFSWTRVEYGGVTYSAHSLRSATPEEIATAFNDYGNGLRVVK